jgi:hypothetical protein
MLNSKQQALEDRFIAAGGNVGYTPSQLRQRLDDPKGAYDNANPYFYYDRDARARGREPYDDRAILSLAHTIKAMNNTERRKLKMAFDQALLPSTTSNSGLPSAATQRRDSDGNIVADGLSRLAKDFSIRLGKLTPEQLETFKAILAAMGEAAEEAEGEGEKDTEGYRIEVEGEEPLTEEPVTEDAPPGQFKGFKKQVPLSCDEQMAFDTMYPELARIKVDTFGIPCSPREPRYTAASYERDAVVEASLDKLFPDAARIRGERR